MSDDLLKYFTKNISNNNKSKNNNNNNTLKLELEKIIKSNSKSKNEEDLKKQVETTVKSINNLIKNQEILIKDLENNNKNGNLINKDNLKTLSDLKKISEKNLELAKSGTNVFNKKQSSENDGNTLKLLQKQIEVNIRETERAEKKREYYDKHPILGKITGYSSNILTNFLGEKLVGNIAAPFKSFSYFISDTMKSAMESKKNGGSLLAGGLKGATDILRNVGQQTILRAGRGVKNFFINEDKVKQNLDKFNWENIKKSNIERAANYGSINDLLSKKELAKDNKSLNNIKIEDENSDKIIKAQDNSVGNLSIYNPYDENYENIKNENSNENQKQKNIGFSFLKEFEKTAIAEDFNNDIKSTNQNEKDADKRDYTSIKNESNKELQEINKKLDDIVDGVEDSNASSNGGILSSILSAVTSLFVLKKLIGIPVLLKNLTLSIISGVGNAIIKGLTLAKSGLFNIGKGATNIVRAGSKVIRAIPVIGNIAGATIAGAEGAYNMYKVNKENKELLSNGTITQDEADIRLEEATARAATNTALGALGPAGLVADVIGAGDFVGGQWGKYRRDGGNNQQKEDDIKKLEEIAKQEDNNVIAPDALTINEATFSLNPDNTNKILTSNDLDNIAHWDNITTNIVSNNGYSDQDSNKYNKISNTNNNTIISSSNSQEQQLPNYISDPAITLVMS